MHAETIEAWAHGYVTSTRLSDKLEPPALPKNFALKNGVVATDALDVRPGRPEELTIALKARGFRNSYRSTLARARAVHTFLHHELQAAELMCWALLRFPDTPAAFRRGLMQIALDEVRHMQLYAQYLKELGYEVGAFPVRDWFWDRVPQCQTPVAFVATMGLGFEAANLDHAERFAQLFDSALDARGAALQRVVGREEISHVAFAAHWFRTWNTTLDFDRWKNALPAPLSPMVMKGRPINTDARQTAGFDRAFCESLQQWAPSGF